MLKQICISLLLTSIVCAQNYLWPTDASKNLTSSFCEYRPGHYHAALDIKTWNKEGYKCFAVEDGFIERIKISPHGAGKALYIKLNDGRTAVYFHLQGFSDALEKKIHEIQLSQKRYSVEWWPKNWKVKKGDLVAYTGQTGIGVPHLHFEIRDASNVPVNPLRFYKDVIDNIRPQLKRLLVIPQDSNSRVNGSFLPAQYDLSYIHDGVFVIKDDIYAKGRIGLALNGYDMADGVSNKFAWYQVKMTVAGKKVFEYAYDRVSFSDSRYVDVDIFYPEKRNSGRSFNKLYLETHNILEFYNRDLGSGLISVDNVQIPFEVEVKDFFGNTSFLKANILPQSPDTLKTKVISEPSDNSFITLNIPSDMKNIRFSSGKNRQSLQAVEYFEIVERQPQPQGMTILFKVRLAGSGDQVIRTVVERASAGNDTSYLPVLLARDKVKSALRLMGKHLHFSFENLAESEDMEIRLVQKDYAKSYPIRSEGYLTEFVIPARDIDSETIRLIVKDTHNIYLDSTWTIFKMVPGKTAHYSMFSDSLQLETGYSNAFDTLLFTVRSLKIDRNRFKLPVLSDAYLIDTGKHILNRNIDVFVKADSVFFKPQQIGLYEIDDDELDYEGGSYNPQTGLLTNRQRNFSTFVIAADTILPEIEPVNIKTNGSYKNLSTLHFKVTDNEAGIGTDENIMVYFDDQYLVPEWDPERNLVKSIIHFDPAPGAHKITVSCKDRAGNVTEKIIPIIIL